jgi:chemotaxis-related protein WspD
MKPTAENSSPAVVTGPDCWNTIGVFGNSTCPELSALTHCHNCAQYTRAGLQLLDRPIQQDYRREQTHHISRPGALSPAPNRSVLVFRIGAEWFALPTHIFQEVVEPRRIHSLPHPAKSILLGLANIRGELVICVSIGHLIGLEQLPGQEGLRKGHGRLLVLNSDEGRLAFAVQEVRGTLRFHLRQITPVPAMLAKAKANYTQGVLYDEGCAIGLLDADLLFSTLNQMLA